MGNTWYDGPPLSHVTQFWCPTFRMTWNEETCARWFLQNGQVQNSHSGIETTVTTGPLVSLRRYQVLVLTYSVATAQHAQGCLPDDPVKHRWFTNGPGNGEGVTNHDGLCFLVSCKPMKGEGVILVNTQQFAGHRTRERRVGSWSASDLPRIPTLLY